MSISKQLLKNKFIALAIVTMLLEATNYVIKNFGIGIYVDDVIWGALSILIILIRLFWYFIIVRDSKIYSTVFGILFMFCLLIYGLGLLAKFEHYAWAGIALTVGGMGCIVIYSIRFVLKKRKQLLDYSKWLFVIVYLLLSLSIIEYYIHKDFIFISTLLFYIMIFLFAIRKSDLKTIDELFSFEQDNE